MALGKKTGGRKKGTPNKKNADLVAAVRSGGETPLDYMLRVMRDPTVDHDRRDDMAKAAAKFVHPTLASVDSTMQHDVSDPLKAFLDKVAASGRKIHDRDTP